MPPGGGDGDAYREALADATAGVVGSLVAMLTFYPIDVWKTNVQAERAQHRRRCRRRDEDDEDDDDEESEEVESIGPPPPRSGRDDRRRRRSDNNPERLVLLLRKKLGGFLEIRDSFRGVHYKVLHTTSSSFAYFFLYSWIQNRHRSHVVGRRSLRRSGGEGESGALGRPYDPSAGTRLLLSGLAAVLNTFLTMPFAVLSARSQTTTTERRRDDADDDETDEAAEEGALPAEEEEEGERRRKMDEAWDEIDAASPAEDDAGASKGGRRMSSERSGEDGYETPEECPSDDDDAGAGDRGDDDRDDDDDDDNEGEEKKAESNDAGRSPSGEFRASPQGGRRPSRPRAVEEEGREAGRWDYTPRERGNLIKRVISKPHLPLRYRAVEERVDRRTETAAERDERRRKERSRDWTVYWSGLWPSLLLCSNPSIHYTVFDVVKASVLRRKASRGGAGRGGAEDGGTRLAMGEAFLIGLVAKFAATIATYPLIRAKVLLMLSGHDGRGGGGGTTGGEGETPKERSRAGRGRRVASKRSSTWEDPARGAATRREGAENDDDDVDVDDGGSRRRNGAVEMLRLLHDMHRNGGVVGGLYRGCNIQLVHTVLQSALLMMVRERINAATRRLLAASKEG